MDGCRWCDMMSCSMVSFCLLACFYNFISPCLVALPNGTANGTVAPTHEIIYEDLTGRKDRTLLRITITLWISFNDGAWTMSHILCEEAEYKKHEMGKLCEGSRDGVKRNEREMNSIRNGTTQLPSFFSRTKENRGDTLGRANTRTGNVFLCICAWHSQAKQRLQSLPSAEEHCHGQNHVYCPPWTDIIKEQKKKKPMGSYGAKDIFV